MIDELLTLSEAEIERVTGYRRPSDQLTELRAQGFHRARKSPTSGRIIVERAHFNAVCRGELDPEQPQVRTVLRMAKA